MNAALVLGGANCVWLDVLRLQSMIGSLWPGPVIAVNDIGCYWPREIHAWVTLHPERLIEGDDEVRVPWIEQRRRRGYPGGYTTYANERSDLVDKIMPHWVGGSSGLFAIAVAHEIGANKAVLCGVPMQKRFGHFSQSTLHDGGPWVHADDHWLAWERKFDQNDGRSLYLQNHVRSMSGRTRDVFGEPTAEWVE